MNLSQKTVVITGASSGIGRSCVRRMRRAGWQVYATVRTEKDRQSLLHEFGDGVRPVILDVEHETSIAKAAAEIKLELGERGLDGLVNVAGIGMIGPIEYASLKDFRRIFEINFFGQVAVIQAFAPELRRHRRGRIVNITTVGVNLALPFGGLLNSSKAAFAMLNDTLRLELHSAGIKVCAIEPGSIATPAVEKTLGDIENVISSLPTEAQRQYGAVIRGFAKRGYAMEKNGSSPDVVAQAVHHALSSRHPRIRYRVGKHAHLLATLPKILPERLWDVLLLRILGLQSTMERREDSPAPMGGKAKAPGMA